MSLTVEGIWAAAPSTSRGYSTFLSSDSKGERIAYASNKSIFVRSIDKPEISRQYTQHTAQTTVARFSPSGFYIASGDVTGTVRIWDSIGAEITKGEYQIISGKINDIAWDGDNARIIAVGDGRERFGRCISADSGNSVGELSGHSAQITSVSIRQQRPLRAATGSNDTTMCFYHGVPFKFNTSNRENHTNYIYGMAFSPDGSQIVSVGSDRRIWLYDGKTGEPVKQIGEGEHKGSIFGVCWAPDSKRFVTSSGDQTVKVWDSETGKCLQSWRQGDDGVVNIAHHQVGVTWPAGRSDGLIISLDLDGNLNYFQEGKDRPVRVVYGNQKPVTAAIYSSTSGKIWTGTADGRLRSYDASTGIADSIDGTTHSNYVSGLATSPQDGRVYSVGWDDTLRTVDESQNSFIGTDAKLSGQPKAVATADFGGKPHTLVATSQGIAIYADGNQVAEHTIPSTPTSIAASGDVVAVGSDDKKVRIFKAAAPASLSDAIELGEITAAVSTLAFSSDGTKLAVGLTSGKIFAYSKASGSWALATNRWSAHTARVTSIAWSPDGERAVSGGLDTNVFVWSLEEPGKRIKANNAHQDGVNGVIWTHDNKIISAGADASLKVWRLDGI